MLRASLVLPKTPAFEAGFLVVRVGQGGRAVLSFVWLRRERERSRRWGFLPLSSTGRRERDSADGRSVARWKANQNELGDEKTSGSKEHVRM